MKLSELHQMLKQATAPKKQVGVKQRHFELGFDDTYNPVQAGGHFTDTIDRRHFDILDYLIMEIRI